MSSRRVVLTVYDYSEYVRMQEAGMNVQVWEKIAVLCGINHFQDVPLWIDNVTGQVSTNELDWARYQARREAEWEQSRRVTDT